MVPSLILQPLAENAVVHGAAEEEERVNVSIDARQVIDSRQLERWLELSVHNTGSPDAEGEGSGAHIGTGNTRERLRALYGENFTLEFRAPPEGGFLAFLRIPFREGFSNEHRDDDPHADRGRRADRAPDIEGLLLRWRAISRSIGECRYGAEAVKRIAALQARPGVSRRTDAPRERPGSHRQDRPRRHAAGDLRDRVRPVRGGCVRAQRGGLPPQAFRPGALSCRCRARQVALDGARQQ